MTRAPRTVYGNPKTGEDPACHNVPMPKASPGITRHAQHSAQQCYGIEMPDAMWQALACSVEQGEHEKIACVGGSRDKYSIGLVREDAKVIHVHVIYDHQSRRIVAVVPKSR